MIREPRAKFSLAAELRNFFTVAGTVPRDVVVILLAAAILPVLSHYFGSRRFFYTIAYESLSADRLYTLYEYLYWFASEFAIDFVVPLILVVALHRKTPLSFGLGTGDARFGLRITALFLLVMIPIVWIASDSQSFRAVYPHAQIVKTDWSLFLVYEAGLMLYFIGWEYVWRGYVLFGLTPHLGAGAAVLIQTIPFVILHNGKPLLETLGAVVAGIALGAMALRARSFWYCVATHWSVMFSIDLFSTLRARHAVDGIGPEAIAALFTRLFS
jgi:uncharacterized protein